MFSIGRPRFSKFCNFVSAYTPGFWFSRVYRKTHPKVVKLKYKTQNSKTWNGEGRAIRWSTSRLTSRGEMERGDEKHNVITIRGFPVYFPMVRVILQYQARFFCWPTVEAPDWSNTFSVPGKDKEEQRDTAPTVLGIKSVLACSGEIFIYARRSN